MIYGAVCSNINVNGYRHLPLWRIPLPVEPDWDTGWQASWRYPHSGTKHDLHYPAGNIDPALDIADRRAEYRYPLPEPLDVFWLYLDCMVGSGELRKPHLTVKFH